MGIPVVTVVVIAISYGIGVNVMLGAQCAALPELFGARHRYIGVAIAREFSAIIAGGIAPFVGALLLGWFSNSWIPLAMYVVVLTSITLYTTFVTPETRAPTSCHPSLRDIPYTASHLARSVVMGIARIPIVRGPVPVVQQGQEASSGPVGLILTRQGIPVLEGTSSEGVAKGTKSGDDAGRREVGQSEL